LIVNCKCKPYLLQAPENLRFYKAIIHFEKETQSNIDLLANIKRNSRKFSPRFISTSKTKDYIHSILNSTNQSIFVIYKKFIGSRAESQINIGHRIETAVHDFISKYFDNFTGAGLGKSSLSIMNTYSKRMANRYEAVDIHNPRGISPSFDRHDSNICDDTKFGIMSTATVGIGNLKPASPLNSKSATIGQRSGISPIALSRGGSPRNLSQKRNKPNSPTKVSASGQSSQAVSPLLKPNPMQSVSPLAILPTNDRSNTPTERSMSASRTFCEIIAQEKPQNEKADHKEILERKSSILMVRAQSDYLRPSSGPTASSNHDIREFQSVTAEADKSNRNSARFCDSASDDFESTRLTAIRYLQESKLVYKSAKQKIFQIMEQDSFRRFAEDHHRTITEILMLS